MHGPEFIHHDIASPRADPVEPDEGTVRRVFIDGRGLHLLGDEIQLVSDLPFRDDRKTAEAQTTQRLRS